MPQKIKWDEDAIIRACQQWAEANNNIAPRPTDWIVKKKDDEVDRPSYPIVLKAFDEFGNMLTAAGFETFTKTKLTPLDDSYDYMARKYANIERKIESLEKELDYLKKQRTPLGRELDSLARKIEKQPTATVEEREYEIELEA